MISLAPTPAPPSRALFYIDPCRASVLRLTIYPRMKKYKSLEQPRKPVHVHNDDHLVIARLLAFAAERGISKLPEPARALFDKGNRRLSKATIIGMGLAIFEASLKEASLKTGTDA